MASPIGNNTPTTPREDETTPREGETTPNEDETTPREDETTPSENVADSGELVDESSPEGATWASYIGNIYMMPNNLMPTRPVLPVMPQTRPQPGPGVGFGYPVYPQLVRQQFPGGYSQYGNVSVYGNFGRFISPSPAPQYQGGLIPYSPYYLLPVQLNVVQPQNVAQLQQVPQTHRSAVLARSIVSPTMTSGTEQNMAMTCRVGSASLRGPCVPVPTRSLGNLNQNSRFSQNISKNTLLPCENGIRNSPSNLTNFTDRNLVRVQRDSTQVENIAPGSRVENVRGPCVPSTALANSSHQSQSIRFGLNISGCGNTIPGCKIEFGNSSTDVSNYLSRSLLTAAITSNESSIQHIETRSETERSHGPWSPEIGLGNGDRNSTSPFESNISGGGESPTKSQAKFSFNNRPPSYGKFVDQLKKFPNLPSPIHLKIKNMSGYEILNVFKVKVSRLVDDKLVDSWREAFATFTRCPDTGKQWLMTWTLNDDHQTFDLTSSSILTNDLKMVQVGQNILEIQPCKQIKPLGIEKFVFKFYKEHEIRIFSYDVGQGCSQRWRRLPSKPKQKK